MNLFHLSIVVALALNVVLGIAVFITNIRRTVNRVFLGLSIVLAGWLLSLLYGSMAQSEEHLVLAIRLASMVGSITPMFLHALQLSIAQQGERKENMAYQLRYWLLCYLPIIPLCMSDLFLVGAELPVGLQTVGSPVYGSGFFLFVLYLVLAFAMLVVKLRSNIRKLVGIRRTEIHFVLLGCLLAFFSAILFTVIPHLSGNMELGMLLPLSDSFRVCIIAYGIAKNRILDVPNVIRKLIAYALMLAYLSVLYYAVFLVAGFVLPEQLLDGLQLHYLLATFAVAFSLAPAHGRMQKIADHLFGQRKPVDVGELIQRSSRLLSSISTLHELVAVVRTLLRESVDTSDMVLLIKDDGHYVEALGGTEVKLTTLALKADDPIVQAINVKREALVWEMLERLRPDQVIREAAARMQALRVHLVSGIFSKEQLVGIILLGPRRSGKIYGLLEQQAVEGLSGQLAVSLENAKLYTEVQNSRIYNDILLDRLVGGVIAVNDAGRITVFNREAQRITGLNQGAVLDTDTTLLPVELRKGLEQAFTRGGSRDVEAILRVGDRSVPIRYGSTLFHSHTGKVLGALIVFTDQTELKKLEQQIRRTDRLASLGTLAAGMAHEIKNPLVSMKTFTQLLPERYDDPDFRETFSRLLGDEVTRIDRIVNQLLRFARPTKPSLAPLKLHIVVDNTLNLVKQQLRQHNISLIREYHAETDTILGDSDMLVQALLNFFLNAIDAMDERGELKVSTRIIKEPTHQFDLWGQPVESTRLRLTISDTGKGIAKENLIHVFDPFFTTKASGTGLGLSVSHGIIHEHDGVIDVESEPGQGTSFHLNFPAFKEEGVTA